MKKYCAVEKNQILEFQSATQTQKEKKSIKSILFVKRGLFYFELKINLMATLQFTLKSEKLPA